VESNVPLPSNFRLYPNVPNPFNPATTIRFTLPTASEVKLTVYSLDGKLVRHFLAGPLDCGTHQVRWQGVNAAGRGVAAGSYICCLEVNGFKQVRRMLLVR